jgi:hypothetical protein
LSHLLPSGLQAIYIPQSKPCALKIIALEVLCCAVALGVGVCARPVFAPCFFPVLLVWLVVVLAVDCGLVGMGERLFFFLERSLINQRRRVSWL